MNYLGCESNLSMPAIEQLLVLPPGGGWQKREVCVNFSLHKIGLGVRCADVDPLDLHFSRMHVRYIY